MLSTSPTLAQILYNITDLGTLPGGFRSTALSINNNGQAVGNSYHNPANPIPEAVLWDSEQGIIALGTLGGDENQGMARSINNSDQIVGWVGFNVFVSVPTLFDSTGSGNNIGLAPVGHSSAYSINDSGQIVGVSGGRATLLDPTGEGNNLDLGTLVGGDNYDSFAFSISNNGQIVGTSVTTVPKLMSCATLFDATGEGNNINLGTLGGDKGSAYSINDNGLIVGESWVAAWDTRATLFDPSGAGNNINLGSLGGDGVHDSSIAYSINNRGQIVGTAMNASGDYSATLFDPTGNGNNIDLNNLIDPALGWMLTEAMCINDNGWIVGTGYNPAGDKHAFLLTPEPGTLLLLGLGAVLLRKGR